MQQSDAHLAKCLKLGLVFADTYPEDLKRYKDANTEFAVCEIELERLKKELEDLEKEEECITQENKTTE